MITKKHRLSTINNTFLEKFNIRNGEFESINEEQIERLDTSTSTIIILTFETLFSHYLTKQEEEERGIVPLGCYAYQYYENGRFETNTKLIHKPSLKPQKVGLLAVLDILELTDGSKHLFVFCEDEYLTVCVPHWLSVWNSTDLYLPSFNVEELLRLDKMIKERFGKVEFKLLASHDDFILKLKRELWKSIPIDKMDHRDGDFMCYGCGLWCSDYFNLLDKKKNKDSSIDEFEFATKRVFYKVRGHFRLGQLHRWLVLPSKINQNQAGELDIYLCYYCNVGGQTRLSIKILGSDFRVTDRLSEINSL